MPHVEPRISFVRLVRAAISVVAIGFFCLWACRMNGDLCNGDTDCDSGFCVQGTCCKTRCAGNCQTCDNGTCEVTTTPFDSCGSDVTCSGRCDGVHPDCVFPGKEKECGQSSCDGKEFTAAPVCSGSGTCKDSAPISCGSFECTDNGCSGCTTDEQCEMNRHCVTGKCVNDQPNGGACDKNETCVSGFCVDHVCCNVACDESCQSCSVPGNPGVCSDKNCGSTGGGDSQTGAESKGSCSCRAAGDETSGAGWLLAMAALGLLRSRRSAKKPRA